MILSRNVIGVQGKIMTSRFLPTIRLFNMSANKKSSITNSNIESHQQQHVLPKLKSDKMDDISYLNNYKLSELFSYFCIGLVTLNKPILNLAIKAFPYVPMPIIKTLVYKIYCGGETMKDLFKTSDNLKLRGINNMMLSLTIEAAEGNEVVDPDYIVDETNKSIVEFLIPNTINKINQSDDINSIPPSYVALKPTGFAHNAADILKNYKTNPEFNVLVDRIAKVIEPIYQANLKLSQQYPERTAPIVVGVIDAEKFDLQEGVYELQRRLYQQFNKLDQPISVVGTLQMYLSGSSKLLALEENLAHAGNYRLGLKLVRGAYLHSEKNRSSIIHKDKNDTDSNYDQGITYCIDNILKQSKNESTLGHLVVASHNSKSLNLATDLINNQQLSNNKNNIVLGQLLGMADNITYNLIEHKQVKNVIKYVPWGPPVETKAYLLRRLEENGDAVKNDTGLNLIKAVCTVLFKRMFRLA